jgi:hypothetical protein
MEGYKQSSDAAVRYPRRNIIAVTLLIFVTALAFLALFNLVSLNASNPQMASYTTVTGNLTCLPHKDTSGPTTLECAFGLKGDDGRYYALTESPDDLLQQDFTERIKVRGVLNQPDAGSHYAINGSIAVRSFTKQ